MSRTSEAGAVLIDPGFLEVALGGIIVAVALGMLAKLRGKAVRKDGDDSLSYAVSCEGLCLLALGGWAYFKTWFL